MDCVILLKICLLFIMNSEKVDILIYLLSAITPRFISTFLEYFIDYM